MKCRRLDLAAKRVGVNPSTPYEWMKTDPQFREDYDTARKVIGQHYLSVCDQRSKKSDIVLMFVTKAFVPETRDKVADVHVNTEARLAVQLLLELRQAGPIATLEVKNASN